MNNVMPNVGVLDPAQLRADYDLIVSTCYEAIRDSDEPQVRMEAARILHRMHPIPYSASHDAPWGVE